MGKGPNQSANELRHGKRPLRAQVHIPSDLPITQIEIEVFAALLDDLDLDSPSVAEAAE